jgi:hypothetical protein
MASPGLRLASNISFSGPRSTFFCLEPPTHATVPLILFSVNVPAVDESQQCWLSLLQTWLFEKFNGATCLPVNISPSQRFMP